MYDNAAPVHIPAAVYVFYACHHRNYLSEAALLHQ